MKSYEAQSAQADCIMDAGLSALLSAKNEL
jgi:hypothetical protein